MSSEQVWLISEMSCGHCVSAVEAAVSAVAGVEAVTVDLKSKRVSVRGSAPPDAVADAIADAGYGATLAMQP